MSKVELNSLEDELKKESKTLKGKKIDRSNILNLDFRVLLFSSRESLNKAVIY